MQNTKDPFHGKYVYCISLDYDHWYWNDSDGDVNVTLKKEIDIILTWISFTNIS